MVVGLVTRGEVVTFMLIGGEVEGMDTINLNKGVLTNGLGLIEGRLVVLVIGVPKMSGV